MNRGNEREVARSGALPSRPLIERIHRERGTMLPKQRTIGAQRLVARLAQGRRRARTYWVSAATAAACAAAAWAVVTSRSHPQPLSFSVEGGDLSAAGLIASDRGAPAVVHFSDGSDIALGAGSRAQVTSVAARGARVRLREGSAQVDIVHAPGTEWAIEAGPFSVRVTGTAFSLVWSASAQDFELHMDRGAVQVTGPLSDGPLALHSGQILTVHLAKGETLIHDDARTTANTNGVSTPGNVPWGAASLRTDGPKLAPAQGPDPLAPAEPTPHSLLRSHEGHQHASVNRPRQAGFAAEVGAANWNDALAAGQFDAIVRGAEGIGVEACLSSAREADLVALADAARYVRRDDLAARALRTVQKRFPATAAARDAEFLLGRLEESRDHASEAVDLYDRYLRETPSGTYASEALGRKMMLTRKTAGESPARTVAEDYLRRYPEGTYAASARALSGP